MALGTATLVRKAAAEGPVKFALLTFDGDGAYAAGGTAAFEAYVQAAVGETADVLFVVDGDSGGYVPVYVNSTDKLKVYESGADGGPGDEVGNGDQSGISIVLWVAYV